MGNAAKDPLPKYAVGDLVLLYTPVVLPGESRKLTEFWTGPYRVTAGVSPWDYSIVNDADVNPKSRLVHMWLVLSLTLLRIVWMFCLIFILICFC